MKGTLTMKYLQLAAFFVFILVQATTLVFSGLARAESEEARGQREEGATKVFAIMGSGLYEKKVVECSQTGGDKGIFNGPFFSYNSLKNFRYESGKMEVQNIAFVYDRKYKGFYHPELRPPILTEWEPVRIKGNLYEYSYVYYCDVASGHVAEFANEINGEVVSVDPPRTREVIRTVSNRGIRIPGETGPFIGAEGVAECLFEWKLKMP